MIDDFPACQRELLALQQGVITRRQALAAGLTDKAIAGRLDGGRWQRLHTGVYATFSGQVPRLATLWAAVLRAGPRAVLSHQTAAELYGLLGTVAPVIHVTVPSGSPVARPQGVLLHYSHRLEAARHPTLLPPRTRVEDCLLDMAEKAGGVDEAIGLVLSASAKRRTTPERIYAAARRRRRLRWRAEIVQALGAAREGAHSLLEFRYGTRVEQPHDLPREPGSASSGGTSGTSTRTSATRSTASWWSLTATAPTRCRRAGGTSAGTTSTPLMASSRCASASWMFRSIPVPARPWWPAYCAAGAGRARSAAAAATAGHLWTTRSRSLPGPARGEEANHWPA